MSSRQENGHFPFIIFHFQFLIGFLLKKQIIYGK